MDVDLVFNADCRRILDTTDLLINRLTTPQYSFMDMEEYERKSMEDPLACMQVYWTEMLARAHMAAVTSIYRNKQWVDSIVVSVQNDNALGFAASMRGLIESSADSASSLLKVPVTLAESHKDIDRALRRKPLKHGIFMNPELEDELIHFLFARKLGKDSGAPRSHAAKFVTEYIKVLEKADIAGVKETYQKLCDITHPGMTSITIWLSVTESLLEWKLQLGQEAKVIEYLATDHEDLMLQLLMYAFNAPLLILAVLNYFPPKDYHTPKIKNWNLAGIPAWRHDISKKLRKARNYCIIKDTPRNMTMRTKTLH